MKKILPLCLFLLAAAGCASLRPPVIGISSSCSAAGASSVPATYVNAIRQAGGVALVIPVTDTPEQAHQLMQTLDGIVFSGGEDINPAWYGETPLNETVSVNPRRDHSDSLLARAALGSGKPILAICRGEQLMNVILGGSLYQDLPVQHAAGIAHRSGNFHAIGLEEGGLLARLYGTDSLMVNSFHHQAVKTPFPGMRVTARAADGIIEAYETDQVNAVQFHPEKMLGDGDASWLAYFKAFVQRCRKRK